MASARKRQSGATRAARGKKPKAKAKAKASSAPSPALVGKIGWLDLTVPDAPKVRDFYRRIVGWEAQPVEMDGYHDFVMQPPGGEGVAGVCHARGPNVGLPSVWLPYFTVANVEISARDSVVLGGRMRTPIRTMGAGRFCVVEDPAGAVCALFQPS